MVKIIIPFAHLTSKNDKFDVWGGRPRLSVKYRDGKKAINKLAKKQLKKKKPYHEPVMVSMVFHMPDNIRRDILNYTQQICDGLEGAAYVNDWFITHAVIERGAVDKKNPRVEIVVIPTTEN